MTHESSQRDEVLPPPGTRIDGRYLVTGVLGEGGMGAVLAAEDLQERQPVAIKLILPDRACDPSLVRRFVSEARVARSLNHRNLTRVLAQGWLGGGQPYMVLEFLTGSTLDELIQPGQTFPKDLAVDFALQVCEGVAEAHAHGIVHRDLKPSNLFVTYDEHGAPWIKVLDFGISKIGDHGATQGSEMTKSDAFLGSPMYMSPEQLRCSKAVDARTDVWALGVILHRLLSGRLPFEARNIASQMALVLAEPPVALRTHAPDAAESIERVVARCLQRELRRRYQDVGQLALALAATSRDPLARVRAQRVVACLARAGAQAPVGPREDAIVRRSPHPDLVDAPEPDTRAERGPAATLTESLDGIVVRFDAAPRRGMRFVVAAAALVAAVGLYRASVPAVEMVQGRLGTAIRPLAAAASLSTPSGETPKAPSSASPTKPTPTASARATQAMPVRPPPPRRAKRAALTHDTTRLGPLEPSL